MRWHLSAVDLPWRSAEWLGRTLVHATILLIALLASAQAAEPKRILLLNSFGPNFAPWSEYQKNFRSEFGKAAEAPFDIYEATLASARFADETEEAPFAEYLRTVFDKRRLDLVVAIGGPAAAFFQRYKQMISPRTPLLLMGVEERRVPVSNLSASDTAVAVRTDVAGSIENILRVLPKTSNIVIVLGSSPIEKYWQGQIRDAITPYADRLAFTWFNDLSFEDMLRQARRFRRTPLFSSAFSWSMRQASRMKKAAWCTVCTLPPTHLSSVIMTLFWSWYCWRPADVRR